MYDYFCAVLLGVLEGLTEFLPISSTGHLILGQHILDVDFESARWKAFTIMIQLGAILAVVVLYRQKIWDTLAGLPTRPEARHFGLLILIGLLPALLLGALFGSTIKALLFSPLVIGTALIVGGLIIIAVEQLRLEPAYRDVDTVPLWVGLLIGCAQAVAMIPGTSRSAATIIGGLALGLERKAAAELSFFLAVPTMTAAFSYELYKNYQTFDADSIGLVAIGFITSFVAALLVIKPFLAIIAQTGFAPFAYYRIALGTLVLTLLAF